METRKQRGTGQVDLSYLFKVLKNNVILILVVAVLCGGAAGLYREVTTRDTYTSQVSFFVNGVATNSAGEMFVTGSSASTAQLLNEAFAKIIKQNGLLSAVQEQLEKDGVDPVPSTKTLSAMISVRFDTQNLYVSVTHPEKEMAYEVARAVEEVVPDWFNYLLNLDTPAKQPNGGESQGIKPVEVLFFANGVKKESITVIGSNYALSKVLADNLDTMMRQENMQIKLQQQFEENGGPVLSAEAWASAVRVDGGDGTIYVSASHTEPDVAALLSDSVAQVVKNWFDVPFVETDHEDGAETEDQADLSNGVYLVKTTNYADEDMITKSGKGSLTLALLGAVVGAVAVYLICYVKTVQDHTIYDEKNLQEQFALPIVGQIPTWESGDARPKSRLTYKRARAARKRRARAMRRGETDVRVYKDRLLTEKTPFAVAEAFKVLRTNMCYTTKGEQSPVYGFTSSYVGAGKSVVSANTAIAFAQMGKRVLLIDGDMRCPVQHKIFGVPAKAEGLSELLAGVQRDKSCVIMSTAVAGLDVIAGGHEPPNPAELLASANMAELIAYARENYDVIFIDLPPVGVVADAGVIGDLVTGYVLVVRSAYSDHKEVQSSITTMESLGAHLIGFVLNDVDLKGKSDYRNGYYSSYDNYVRRVQRDDESTSNESNT